MDKLVTSKDFLTCIRNIPFSASYFNEVLDFLLIPGSSPYSSSKTASMLDFYVYHAIMDSTGPPYSIHYDIRSEVGRLREEQFLSDFDSEMALSRAFDHLHDMHTRFPPRVLYGLATFFFPLRLTSRVEGDKQRIYVENDDFTTTIGDHYNEVFRTEIPFSEYQAFEVIALGYAVDAMSFLVEFAEEHVPYSKETSTNFNFLLQNFHRRSTFMLPVPEGPLRVVLRNPQTQADFELTLDFLSCFYYDPYGCVPIMNTTELATYQWPDGPPADIRDVLQLDDEDSAPKLDAALQHYLELSTTERMSEVFRARAKENAAEMIESDSRFTPVFSCRGGECSVFEDTETPTTAVFQLTTFMPSGSVPDYLDDLQSCFQVMADKSYTHLIVDLRDNGGGMIAASVSVSKALIKRTTPNVSEFFSPSVLTPELFVEVNEKGSYFSQVIGGILMNASHLDVNVHGAVFSPFDLFFFFPPNVSRDFREETGYEPLEPENVVVLTKGTCGSACGMLAKSILQTNSAKGVFLGGVRGRPNDPSSFDGASVLTSTPFKQGKSLSFAWTAIFPSWPSASCMNDRRTCDYTQLMEFTRTSTDFVAEDWSGLDHTSMEVLPALYKFFNQCAPGRSVHLVDTPATSCPHGMTFISHGLYGHPCKADGSGFDTSKCVLKRCDVGFYLNASVCVPSLDDVYVPFWESQEYVPPVNCEAALSNEVAKNTQLRQTIDGLTEEVNQLRSELGTIQQELSDTQAALGAAEAKETRLNTEVAALKVTITQFQANCTGGGHFKKLSGSAVAGLTVSIVLAVVFFVVIIALVAVGGFCFVWSRRKARSIEKKPLIVRGVSGSYDDAGTIQ